MSEISERIARLSPEKRVLLERRLMEEGGAADEGAPIPRRKTGDRCPLSFAQERLWFLDQLEPDSPAYNVPRAFRLRGALDLCALDRALQEIVRRHEALRTTFASEEGLPVQVIASKLIVPLPVTDLTTTRRRDSEARAIELAEEEARLPFDLTQGPLIRARLLRLGIEDHIFLLTMHHIVSDGWSMGVLCRELSALYKTFRRDNRSSLPDLPIQYADFAVWQRNWLAGEELERQLSYWRNQLADPPPLLELPTDRARPAIQRYRGARVLETLTPALSASLKALSRDERATLFMTLLAAFQVLLHRYSGQDDILIGAPIASRDRVEIEDLIGFFVNTLVLRGDLSGNPTFRDLLARTREACMEAYAHQDVPFESLVRDLAPERSMSHAPLFQVMFALQNVPSSDLELSGLAVDRLKVDAATSKFDLSVTVKERVEGLRVQVTYNTDLYDRTTIERMIGHYRTLLEGIVGDPNERIAFLPLLTERERHRILVEWNDTEADYPEELCVHHLFEAQVKRTPDAVAVVFEDQQLTYRELNERANQLAHYLRRHGVGSEVLLGICVQRCPEMVVGVLGILKAGGGYVPLDPEDPVERMALILEQAGATAVITQEEMVERLADVSPDLFCLDADWVVVARESREDPDVHIPARSAAYAMFTSGSTGRPKGVLVEHRGVTNYVRWVTQHLLPSYGLNLPLITKLTFDASLKQLFAPLIAGRDVWVLPDTVASQPTALLRALSMRSSVGLNCVPSLWRSMLSAMDADQRLIPRQSLTHLFLGGEAVSDETVRRTFTRFPDLRVFNVYGPTEATANATAGELLSTDGPVIGRPIANTQVYVLDSHMRPIPVGTEGELHISGVGLARGYLSHPDLTAEAFVPNPYSDKPGDRLYRTGDLARWRPEGRVEFLGRLDHQVKVRGFRIEPGEIESALQAHPAVQGAVVVAREDKPEVLAETLNAERRLVAYIVPRQGTEPTTAAIRSFLRDKLPRYMIPSQFMFLDSLPLTPVGKVDRRALPVPDNGRPELDQTFIGPSTPSECLIARIWREALGIDRVGVYDNFFDLGGHSLLAVRVIAQIEEKIGLRFRPGDLMFQSLGQLAAAAEERMESSTSSEPSGFLRNAWRALKKVVR